MTRATPIGLAAVAAAGCLSKPAPPGGSSGADAAIVEPVLYRGMVAIGDLGRDGADELVRAGLDDRGRPELLVWWGGEGMFRDRPDEVVPAAVAPDGHPYAVLGMAVASVVDTAEPELVVITQETSADGTAVAYLWIFEHDRLALIHRSDPQAADAQLVGGYMQIRRTFTGAINVEVGGWTGQAQANGTFASPWQDVQVFEIAGLTGEEIVGVAPSPAGGGDNLLVFTRTSVTSTEGDPTGSPRTFSTSGAHALGPVAYVRPTRSDPTNPIHAIAAVEGSAAIDVVRIDMTTDPVNVTRLADAGAGMPIDLALIDVEALDGTADVVAIQDDALTIRKNLVTDGITASTNGEQSAPGVAGLRDTLAVGDFDPGESGREIYLLGPRGIAPICFTEAAQACP